LLEKQSEGKKIQCNQMRGVFLQKKITTLSTFQKSGVGEGCRFSRQCAEFQSITLPLNS